MPPRFMLFMIFAMLVFIGAIIWTVKQNFLDNADKLRGAGIILIVIGGCGFIATFVETLYQEFKKPNERELTYEGVEPLLPDPEDVFVAARATGALNEESIHID